MPSKAAFSARKAIFIPFSNAIPQKALIDPENCLLCGKCAQVCPTQAVDYFQEPEDFTLEVKAAILATGFGVTPLENKPQFGAGRLPNVITALQMERLLAPHGPYNRVLRPGTARCRTPSPMCNAPPPGSNRGHSLLLPRLLHVRHQAGHAPLRALPLVDVTIYYLDIRAFGKGYEQFFQNAQAMGVQFVKAKPAIMERAQTAVWWCAMKPRKRTGVSLLPNTT